MPAAFIGAMLCILAWIYGDPWTILRFRATFWPLILVLAAGGGVLLWRRRRPPVITQVDEPGAA